MEKVFYYKIRDVEDEETYSQFLTTDKKCEELIECAIADWYGGDDNDNRVEADNVFECIEQRLTTNDIQWQWIKFTNIDF